MHSWDTVVYHRHKLQLAKQLRNINPYFINKDRVSAFLIVSVSWTAKTADNLSHIVQYRQETGVNVFIAFYVEMCTVVTHSVVHFHSTVN